jgi:hypothetical protein
MKTQLTYMQQIQAAAFLCGEEYSMYGFEDAQDLAKRLALQIAIENDASQKMVLIDIDEEIEFQV